MPTAFIQLNGTCKWAKVQKNQLDPKFKNWTICLYPTKESIETFMKSGLSMGFKEDEDGRYLTFRRPESKLFGKELVEFDPPGVWLNGAPYKGSIGNGSAVTLKVEVFDTAKGKGHRLDGVRVDNLVEYKPIPDGEAPTKRVAMPF